MSDTVLDIINGTTQFCEAINEAPLHARAKIAQAAPQWISIDQLHESPLNPRKYISESGIEELAASMREHGFRPWVPIVARPIIFEDKNDFAYEIAAGHRRRLAAIRAGLTEVPCVIVEMTDEEFQEILTFDNVGREDLHPLHEAMGYRDFMNRQGATVPEIAARIGKSASYVYKLLKFCDLCAQAQLAFLQNKIHAEHAILIARRKPEEQLRALQVLEPPAYAPDKPQMSSRQLAAWIQRNFNVNLDDAPFNCGDAGLVPAAGACYDCPSLSTNAPDFNPTQDLADVCQDRACYDRKVAAHEALIQIEEAPEPEPAPKPAPAPVAATPKPSKAEKEAAKQAEQDRAKAEEEERLAEMERLTKERLEIEEKEKRELAIRQKLLSAVIAKVKWPPSKEAVAFILSDWIGSLPEGCDDIVAAQGFDAGEPLPLKQLTAMNETQIARLAMIASVADDFDHYSLHHGCDKLKALAKTYGVDAMKIRAEAEGGTRKEADGQGKPAPAQKAAPAKKAAAKKKSASVAKKQGLAARVAKVVKGGRK